MDHSSNPDLSPQMEKTLREIATSNAINFATSAPFQLTEVKIEKIGFADLPLIWTQVYCRGQDIRAIVPIVRAYVFRELETAGVSSEALEFVPRVQCNERRMFVDCNESSPTKGNKKRGQSCRFSFEIKPAYVNQFDWGGFARKYGSLPKSGG